MKEKIDRENENYCKPEEIIKKESLNFYLSSFAFPKCIREKVFKLYGFVRLMDNFVDEIPANIDKYYYYKKEYLKKRKSKIKIIQDFKDLSKNFEKKWVDAFFKSLEMDIYNYKYEKFKDLEKYLYGISEVIGLMMARILNLNKESYSYARLFGKSLQLANIIRDIKEDTENNRNYIPKEFMKKFNVKTISKNEKNIGRLILYLIDIYEKLASKAENGYKYLPKKMRVAVKTSSDNYKWTIKNIKKNPLVVFDKQIKPGKIVILYNLARNTIFA